MYLYFILFFLPVFAFFQFNKLLKINENEILILFDIDGNIWFNFRNVIKAFGYTNINDVIYNAKITEKNKIYYKNLRLTDQTVSLKNMQPNQLFINESGLYEFLSFSNKDLAKKFMNKYFQEIMPEIRKYGKYEVSEKDKQKLNELNTTIDNYKQEMTYYNDKYLQTS